ncbi:MAG: hypothetical protein AAFV53_43885 [Myxococcota bacterium]
MIAAVWVMLACTPPPSDRALYLQVSQNPSDPTPCQRIEDPSLSAECVALSAPALPEADALAACETLPSPSPWRDECFFLVADALVAEGPLAVKICGQAGRFERRCLGHAFGRQARTLLANHPRGHEREAFALIKEMGRSDYGEAPAQTARKTHDLLVRHVAGRDPGERFSRATCGDLPRTMCQEAFALRIREQMSRSGKPLSTLCDSEPLDVDDAEAVGAPGWDADADEIAAKAVRRICVASENR